MIHFTQRRQEKCSGVHFVTYNVARIIKPARTKAYEMFWTHKIVGWTDKIFDYITGCLK